MLVASIIPARSVALRFAEAGRLILRRGPPSASLSLREAYSRAMFQLFKTSVSRRPTITEGVFAKGKEPIVTHRTFACILLLGLALATFTAPARTDDGDKKGRPVSALDAAGPSIAAFASNRDPGLEAIFAYVEANVAP